MSTGRSQAASRSRPRIEEFQSAPADTKPYALLRRMFTDACSAVHENALVAEHQGQQDGHDAGRLDLPRRRRVRGERRRHPGLLHPPEDDPPADDRPRRHLRAGQARASCSSGRRWRARGAASSRAAWAPEPFCQPDFATQLLSHGDFVLQCTDGLHACVLDEEMREIVARSHPYDACKELVALAVKRGSDDNISLQLIEVRNWEQVAQSARVALGADTPPKKAVGRGRGRRDRHRRASAPACCSTAASSSPTSSPAATWRRSSRPTTGKPARAWRSRFPSWPWRATSRDSSASSGRRRSARASAIRRCSR